MRRKSYRDRDPTLVRRQEDIHPDPHGWREGGSFPTRMENSTRQQRPSAPASSSRPADFKHQAQGPCQVVDAAQGPRRP